MHTSWLRFYTENNHALTSNSKLYHFMLGWEVNPGLKRWETSVLLYTTMPSSGHSTLITGINRIYLSALLNV